MTESRSRVRFFACFRLENSRARIEEQTRRKKNFVEMRITLFFLQFVWNCYLVCVNLRYWCDFEQVSNLAKDYQCGNRTRRMVRNRIRTRTFRNPWLDSMVNRNSLPFVSWDDRESRFLPFTALLIASPFPFPRRPCAPLAILFVLFSLLLFLLGKWRRSFPDYRRTSQFDSVESAVGYERNHSIGRETAGRFLQRQGSSPVRSWGL